MEHDSERLAEYMEVVECGRRRANIYLRHGYRLIAMMNGARERQYPEDDIETIRFREQHAGGPSNARRYFLRRDMRYVVGRPASIMMLGIAEVEAINEREWAETGRAPERLGASVDALRDLWREVEMWIASGAVGVNDAFVAKYRAITGVGPDLTAETKQEPAADPDKRP